MGNKVESGKIKFIQNFAPLLDVDDYSLEIEQVISSNDGNHPITSNNRFKSSKVFAVRGERFKIGPAEINSVYPPENTSGKFDDTLPHLTLSKLPLPWERRIYDADKTDTSDKRPWLALLLFDEDDPAPIPKKIKLKELVKKNMPEGVYFPANFKLEFGELPDQECTVIDVPKSLFQAIAPTVHDLTLMAHARHVFPGDKIRNKGQIPSGDYSVLIGNRLPKPGKESIVHFISLEDYGSVLESKEDLKNFHTIRLVSFRHWRFSCEDTSDKVGSFKDLVTSLDSGKDGDGMLRMSVPERSNDEQETDDDKTKAILNYLKMGYIPLSHKMRQGYKNLALYRSPLVPLELPLFLERPFRSQDELYFYSPENGFFDLTYAAAWQLGQLLALENKVFAKNLFNWKRENSQKEIIAAEQKLLSKTLSIEKEADGSFKNALNALQTQVISKVEPEKKSVSKNERKENPFQRNKPIERVKDKTTEMPKVVENFIDELRELNFVPFHYLVPDLSMLPPESIRLFAIDNNWTEALVDGALSLGNFAVKPDESDSQTTDQITQPQIQYGFLMRTSVLIGWSGLEIFVNPEFESDKKTVVKKSAAFTRLERLAPDIAIGIVSEKINTILFREPGEGLHFGVDFPGDDGNDFKKGIRPLVEGDKTDIEIQGNFKSDAHRILDLTVLKTAFDEKIKDEKIKSEGLKGFGVITTADFGYLMIEGVDAVLYTVK